MTSRTLYDRLIYVQFRACVHSVHLNLYKIFTRLIFTQPKLGNNILIKEAETLLKTTPSQVFFTVFNDRRRTAIL